MVVFHHFGQLSPVFKYKPQNDDDKLIASMNRFSTSWWKKNITTYYFYNPPIQKKQEKQIWSATNSAFIFTTIHDSNLCFFLFSFTYVCTLIKLGRRWASLNWNIFFSSTTTFEWHLKELFKKKTRYSSILISNGKYRQIK